jgi:hypothetical protein
MRTNRTYDPGRPEVGTQLSQRKEVLAIGEVGFPARNILHVLRADKKHLYPTASNASRGYSCTRRAGWRRASVASSRLT